MLESLFNKYQCDKSKKHKYHLIYEPYFEKKRYDEINILEVGTFKGASASAFRDYFPNANIYTIDIFVRTQPEDLSILQDKRVHWLKHDTMNAGLPYAIQDAWGDIEFDFIIDDGAHWPMANLLTLKNCIRFLKEKGVYFIEDVWPMDIMSWNELQNPWLRAWPERYNNLDNNMFVEELKKYNVTPHDNRKLCADDSFIYAIKTK